MENNKERTFINIIVVLSSCTIFGWTFVFDLREFFWASCVILRLVCCRHGGLHLLWHLHTRHR